MRPEQLFPSLAELPSQEPDPDAESDAECFRRAAAMVMGAQ